MSRFLSLNFYKVILFTLQAAIATGQPIDPEPQQAAKQYRWVHVGPYRALMVDTGFGDKLQAGVFVNAGSNHDEPTRFAGRAHLFEHIFFSGSLKYPGLKDWDSQSQSIGNHNGWTAGDHTFYFLNFRPDGLAKAFDLLGSYFSNPAFSKEGFQRELITVSDEASRYQTDEGRSTHNIRNFYLYADDDFRKRYSVGTQEQLANMTIDDLANFFFANYKPDNIVIVLAGNLSKVSTETVVDLIEKNFSFPSQEELEQRLSKTWQRPIRLTETPAKLIKLTHPQQRSEFVPMAKMESRSGDRSLLISTTFTGQDHFSRREVAALRLFLGYLHMTGPGSWSDHAKDSGIILDSSYGISITNNQLEVLHAFNLNEQTSETLDVLDSFVTHLGQLLHRGFDPDVMQIQKNLFAQQLKESFKSPSGALKTLVGVLPNVINTGDFNLDPVFDTRPFLASLSDQEILAAAQKFIDFSTLILLEKTPQLVGGEATIFDQRRILRLTPTEKETISQQIADSLSGSSKYGNYHFVPQVAEVPLISKLLTKVTTDTPAKIIRTTAGSTTRFLALQSSTLYPEKIAARIYFMTPFIDNPRDEVALDSLILSFLETIRPQAINLSSQGIRIGFSNAENGDIHITYDGPSQYLQSTTEFLLSKLRGFKPDVKMLDQALLEKVDEYRSPPRFSISAADEYLSKLTSTGKFTQAELLQTTMALQASDILANKRALSSFYLRSADLQVSLYGDITEQDGLNYHAWLSSQVDSPLTTEERALWLNRRLPIKETLKAWRKTPLGIDAEDTVAIGAIDVPWTPGDLFEQPKSYATLLVLSDVLGYAVHARNRDQMGLGYIHQSSIQVMSHANELNMLMAYGSSKRPQSYRRMLAGWRWVYKQLMAGHLFDKTDSSFESLRSGVYNKFKTNGDTPMNQALRNMIFASRTTRTSFENRDKAVEFIPQITLADIQDMMKIIVRNNSPTIQIEVSANPTQISLKGSNVCEQLLILD